VEGIVAFLGCKGAGYHVWARVVFETLTGHICSGEPLCALDANTPSRGSCSRPE
jgi:hypothetical protein